MKYLIDGGLPLKGTAKIFGAKNSVFKLMLAACLTNENVKISNICLIRNVEVVKETIESLGGVVELDKNNKIATIEAQNLNKFEVPFELGKESRASSMIIPILLHRFKKAKVPNPGGDNIGARSLDRHFKGLEKLGAKISFDGEFITAAAPDGLVGTTYRFEKNTHTGTETMILAAVLAEGTTKLENSAQEPEVNDLISFLNQMGADITRLEPRTILINGVERLHQTEFQAMPDRNEAVTFAIAALATKGDVTVLGAKSEHLQAFLEKVEAIGGGVEKLADGVRFFWKGQLRATNIETTPYPGFMTDWQAMWVTLMTQAVGESIVHETVYESRFAYVDSLKKMGAQIELFNPKVEKSEDLYNFNHSDLRAGSFHAAKISGPTKLRGENLVVSDIRAGATLTLAALAAEGQSTIDNVEMIERGYENLEERLKTLGAKISKSQ